jgi:hypothetical protein
LESAIKVLYICYVLDVRNEYMKIKKSILDKINNPGSRNRIGLDLRIGEQAVAVQMRKNADDGRLTKMDALKAISKETGIEVTDILEERKVAKTAQN